MIEKYLVTVYNDQYGRYDNNFFDTPEEADFFLCRSINKSREVKLYRVEEIDCSIFKRAKL